MCEAIQPGLLGRPWRDGGEWCDSLCIPVRAMVHYCSADPSVSVETCTTAQMLPDSRESCVHIVLRISKISHSIWNIRGTLTKKLHSWEKKSSSNLGTKNLMISASERYHAAFNFQQPHGPEPQRGAAGFVHNHDYIHLFPNWLPSGT